MAYITSTLSTVVDEVISQGERVTLSCTMTVYNDSFEYSDVEILSMDDIRDYNHNFTNSITVECSMPEGDYRDYIYTNRRNIKVRLTISDGTTETITSYKAYLMDEDDMSATGGTSLTTEELNNRERRQFTIEMINPIAEKFMAWRCSDTIFRQCTVSEAIRSLYGDAAEQIGIVDGNLLKGVDIWKTAKGFPKYEVMHIEDDLLLSSLSRYLQDHPNYGIYPTGVSRFLANDLLYVYPTFNVDRYATESAKLTILSPPSDAVPVAESTYRMNGEELQIVVTEDPVITDGSEIDTLTSGNVMSAVNGKTFFSESVVTANGGATLQPDYHALNAIAYHRKDSSNNVVKTDPYITSNYFNTTKKMAMSAGRLLTATWVSSDPGLLYPGMPVQYRYYEEGEVKSIDGVLHHVHSFYSSKRRMSDADYMCTTKLIVFIRGDLY